MYTFYSTLFSISTCQDSAVPEKIFEELHSIMIYAKFKIIGLLVLKKKIF